MGCQIDFLARGKMKKTFIPYNKSEKYLKNTMPLGKKISLRFFH
jgi:hypothetical protein